MDASCNAVASKKLGISLVQDASNRVCANTTNDVVDGNWHYVVMMRSGSSLLVYVDGTSVAVTTQATAGVGIAANINNTVPVRIGDLNGNLFYVGAIDDVRIYNRALSAAEVYQLYNLGH